MIRNYFLMGYRKLMRNKTFSFINIAGLAIGIATCLIIMLFVYHELSYDRFNEKADRIVRVAFNGSFNNTVINEASVMPPVAMAMKADFPEVQDATRLYDFGKPAMTIGEKAFRDEKFAFVDSNFLSVFTIPLVKGDVRAALLQPNSIVISQAAAQKYFGKEDPIGKTIYWKDQQTTYTVTGLFDKIPDNSHFHFDLLASMSGFPDARKNTWMQSGYFTYLVLAPGSDNKKLEGKLSSFMEKHMGPEFAIAFGMDFDAFREKGNKLGFYLQPLTSIHLQSQCTNEMEAGGNIQYVYIFGAIAIFMLLIACINFMNLSTAGASKRAREVGIRKVMGSGKSALVSQFLLESTLITFISLILAIVLVGFMLPFFNQLSGKQLEFSLFANSWLIPTLIIIGLFVGLVAGSYPAFYLSAFKPVSVLKGKFTAGKSGMNLRSGLVVFQFCISIILIVGTTVVYQQLKYIQNKELGYDKDQVMIISDTWMLGNKESSFRQQLLSDPRIIHASISGFVPAGPSYSNNFFLEPEDNRDKHTRTLRYDVDTGYIPTLGIKIAEGRNFSAAYGTDSLGIILNETAVRQFGWGKNVIGRTLVSPENTGTKKVYHVIGVVKDFHFRSLHESITPLVMVLSQNSSTIILKLNTRDIAGVLASVRSKWTAFTTEAPLNYSFLDERYNLTYSAERKTGLILAIFAGLTIFIACLGLFGLTIFTAEQRTREIGIRKVLGSSVSGIIQILSRDFVKLVVIAFILAVPVGWWVMHLWLQGFAYRIDISWIIFAKAAGIALLITIVTMSFQSIKAALANPVNSLRSE
jgi:putative ABC transport system permease protein